MTEQEFLSLLKNDILESDTDFNMKTNLNDIEEWDSLGVISFIAMGKERGSIDTKAVHSATTVEELYTVVKDL